MTIKTSVSRSRDNRSNVRYGEWYQVWATVYVYQVVVVWSTLNEAGVTSVAEFNVIAIEFYDGTNVID